MNFYIVCYNNYFGQSLPTERSLDTDKLKFFLESYGHQVTKIDIYEVANHPVVDDGFYIIGSHQNSEIKRYYDDIVSIKFTNRGSCIPEAKFVLAHENKGIQERRDPQCDGKTRRRLLRRQLRLLPVQLSERKKLKTKQQETTGAARVLNNGGL